MFGTSVTYLDFKVRQKIMFVPQVNLPFSVNGARPACMLVCVSDSEPRTLDKHVKMPNRKNELTIGSVLTKQLRQHPGATISCKHTSITLLKHNQSGRCFHSVFQVLKKFVSVNSFHRQPDRLWKCTALNV